MSQTSASEVIRHTCASAIQIRLLLLLSLCVRFDQWTSLCCAGSQYC